MQKHACFKRSTWIDLKSSNTDPNWPTLQYNVAAISLSFCFVFFSPPSWKPHYGVRLISSIHASHEALWQNNKQPRIDFKTCIKKMKIPAVHASVSAHSVWQQTGDKHTHAAHTRVESDVTLCARCSSAIAAAQVSASGSTLSFYSSLQTLGLHLTFFFFLLFKQRLNAMLMS